MCGEREWGFYMAVRRCFSGVSRVFLVCRSASLKDRHDWIARFGAH